MVAEAIHPSISPAMEDYLLAIYRLESDTHRVGTGDIAQELDVSAASATAMFKRLAREDLVSYREYGGVHLTGTGRESALGLIRRHRLAERFLTEILELPWDDVHRIADRLEHALPPEVIERFDGILHHPKTCPHGHLIPRSDGTLPARTARPLSQVQVGEQATILLVDEHNSDLLKYLGELDLRPGAMLSVLDREPFDGGLQVEVDGMRRLLSGRVAEAVFVSEGTPK